MARYIKYTKELLESAVSESISVAQVLRKLGIKETGGSHKHISNKITDYKINKTHFTGQNAGRAPFRTYTTRSPANVLVLRMSGSRSNAIFLRRSLIELGVEYKCSLCGLGDTWNNKTIRLEIDHINNNWLDDRKENLRFLCPNCHSQQPHKYNKGFTGLTSRNTRLDATRPEKQ